MLGPLTQFYYYYITPVLSKIEVRGTGIRTKSLFYIRHYSSIHIYLVRDKNILEELTTQWQPSDYGTARTHGFG
jgi:hypothetical protein